MNRNIKKLKTDYSCFVSLSQLIRYLILCLFFFLVALFMLYLTVWFMATDSDPVNMIPPFIFSVLSFSACLALYKTELFHYLTKVHITTEGVHCTRFGRVIKSLKWQEIAQIVAIKMSDYKENYYNPHIFVSEHCISEEDRKDALKLIGKKNDVILLPYNKKTLKALPKQYRPKRVILRDESLPTSKTE